MESEGNQHEETKEADRAHHEDEGPIIVKPGTAGSKASKKSKRSHGFDEITDGPTDAVTKRKRPLCEGEEAYLQQDYKESNVMGSTFWMSLADYCKYFYITTVCYHDSRHVASFC